jgi:dTMP kinase
LLFAAARADHVERTVKPALARGAWVLCDRFLDSSLAYQGAAAGVGIDAVKGLHEVGSGGFLPDRTFLLELPADVASERLRVRDSGKSDRIGGRGEDFHARVSAAFAQFAAEDPVRYRRIDAAAPAAAVTAKLLDALADLMPPQNEA